MNSVYFFSMGYNVSEKRKRKKSEICTVALQIILELGLEGLSMHVLAKRQGVTVGALYRYFESKQLLIAELELQCLDAVCKSLDDVYAGQADMVKGPHWGLHRLWGIVSAYHQNLKTVPAYARLISGILASPHAVVEEPFRVQAVRKMFEVLAVPARLIEQLQAEGQLTHGDATQRALTLWLTVHGVIQLEKMESISNGLIRVEELLRAGLTDHYLGWSNRSFAEVKSLWEVR